MTLVQLKKQGNAVCCFSPLFFLDYCFQLSCYQTYASSQPAMIFCPGNIGIENSRTTTFLEHHRVFAGFICSPKKTTITQKFCWMKLSILKKKHPGKDDVFFSQTSKTNVFSFSEKKGNPIQTFLHFLNNIFGVVLDTNEIPWDFATLGRIRTPLKRWLFC